MDINNILSEITNQASKDLKPSTTIVTKLDGSRYIEKADGCVALPSSTRDEDGNWAIMDMMGATGMNAENNNASETAGAADLQLQACPELLDLITEYPEVAQAVKTISLGVPRAAVCARIRGEMGKAVELRFSQALDMAGLASCSSQSELDCQDSIAVMKGDEREMHGALGVGKGWSPPQLVTRNGELARPGYASMSAHEYMDTPPVLRAKVACLAGLIRSAKRPIFYCGAGLSTSSGICDYATRGEGVVKRKEGPKSSFLSPVCATPSEAHHAIAALAREGLLWRLIQQNHDGLPQKAGVPQSILNEIHGGWFDPSNPVVAMTGDLRSDLFQDLLNCEKHADLAIAMGTSLCGMNADRVISSCAARFKKAKSGALGSVIINLQKTVHDANASLRIFGLIDDVFRLLLEELGITPTVSQPTTLPPNAAEFNPSDDVFFIPFSVNGSRLEDAAPRRRLDLSENAPLIITCGPNQGDVATVLGKNADGHYRIKINHVCRAGDPKVKAMWSEVRLLGKWWPVEAALGVLDYFPVASPDPEPQIET